MGKYYIERAVALCMASYAADEHPYEKGVICPEARSEYNQGWNDACDYIRDGLEEATTADVVPVVRCKGCGNFRQNAHGVCWCDEYGGAITPADYCSRAKMDGKGGDSNVHSDQ